MILKGYFKKKILTIYIDEEKISLICPQGISAKITGLLNHQSLKESEGIYEKNSLFFHTFGMNFPIGVLGLNKNLELITFPKIINVKSVFMMPFGVKYTLEIHPNHISKIATKKNKLKNIKIYETNKFISKINKIIKYLHYRKILQIIFLFLSLSFHPISFAETILLNLGKTKIIDLEKPPLTIEISQPEVLQVERVGITNSVKLLPQQEGECSLRVTYTGGEEKNWSISISSRNNDENIQNPYYNIQNQNKDLFNKYILKMNKIEGIKSLSNGQKIIVLGSIKNRFIFSQIYKIMSTKPSFFIPLFEIDDSLNSFIANYLQNKILSYGERNLKITVQKGIFQVYGVPTSPANKAKIMELLTAILPQCIDNMSYQTGDSNLIQINLDFLEISQGKRKDIGFKSSFLNELGASLQFPAGGLNAVNNLQPVLQIAPIPLFFKAIHSSNEVRELAKPVIITRSGQKASFLAGGEIPIVSSTNTSTSSSSSVTFKEFGIMFHVLPQLQSDGNVWISLELEVSQIAEDLGINSIPGFTKRKLNTNMILAEGQTAILSGLIQNKDSKSYTKVPLLGSIPILGEFFKNRNNNNNQNELLVAVTAIKGEQNENSYKMNDLKKRYSNFNWQNKNNLLE